MSEAKSKQDDGLVESRSSPVYTRVRDWLLGYIAEQGLESGARIPSERVLATSLGLSRPTVAKAVVALVEEGILSREERSGTFVGVQGLASRRPSPRTRTVAMVMPFIGQASSGVIDVRKTTSRYTDHFIRDNISSDIMHGVLSVLKTSGCRLVVHHNDSAEEEAELLADLVGEEVDGALVMPETYMDNADPYASLGIIGPPVVFVDRFITGSSLDYVVTDNAKSTKDAVASLTEKDHRRIAFFTDFAYITAVADRESGYRAALEEAGIPVDEDIICGPQNMRHSQWSFLFALEHCIRLPDPVTAVFGTTDDIVWATLQAAKKLNLRVPEDLEVAGFFDAPVPPGIETHFLRVVQAKFKIGQIAAQLLLDRMDGTVPPEPRHIYVPAELMTY